MISKVSSQEKNKKMDFMGLLISSPAYQKLNLYDKKDLEDAADLINKCISWVPSDRVSAQEAL